MEPRQRMVWVAPEERKRLDKESARQRAKEIKAALVRALSAQEGWTRQPGSRWTWTGADLVWTVILDKGSFGPWHVNLRADWPLNQSGDDHHWLSASWTALRQNDAQRAEWSEALHHADPRPQPDRAAFLQNIVESVCDWARSTPSVGTLQRALITGELQNAACLPATRHLLGAD